MSTDNLMWFENVEARPHPWPGLIWVTSVINLPDVKKARDLYIKAFNFVSIFDFPDPQDASNFVMTRLRYRGANFVINKVGSDYEGQAPATSNTPSPFLFYVYFDDVDAIYKQAVEAGMTSVMKPDDTFWGDRRARLTCPFGYVWDIAQRVK
ncbi:MAG: VOC family protein [Alphaproteobacteria bacterium]|jgi:PhnB protein|nr:VOC family protein [Alphaproteobacteria bacterium]